MSQDDYVVDHGQSKISDLWKKEDYWAIWIGVLILAICTMMIMPAKGDFAAKFAPLNEIIKVEKEKPYETIALVEAGLAKKKIVGTSLPAMKELSSYLATPKKWTTNPLKSMVLTQAEADEINKSLLPKVEELKAKADAAKQAAYAAEDAAKAADYKDAGLNKAAQDTLSTWIKENKAYSSANGKLAKPYNLIGKMLVTGVCFAIVLSIGMAFMGQPVGKFVVGFVGVFVICIVANMLGKQASMSYYGINAEIMSIVLGLLIANTVGTPKWMMPGVQVEYYIKTGLVLLGIEVLLNKILSIGLPGIFVAWVVTPTVLISTYIFGQKVLKIPSKTLNIIICADMSVCGTSAAIAAAAACRAKKEELTLAVGLSLTFTAIMMVVMPMLVSALGLNAVLGGAWIGGTIDSTGAVAAAGAFLGPTAMQVAATIKMIQNVLIGVSAFFIAVYWCAKVDCVDGQRVSPMEIWHRFPKFVIGFLGVSIVYTMIAGSLGTDLSYSIIDKGVVTLEKGFRGWLFALSFVSIGLATNFKELAAYFKGGKPLILYVVGQSFNIILTLTMAYVMFMLVFPEITAELLKG